MTIETASRADFSPHAIVYPTRSAWEEARQNSIGASEAWAVLSGHGAAEVWLRKTRPEQAESPVSELDGDVGRAMEEVIAKHYRQQTGHEVIDPGDYATWHHPDYPRLTATPDRLVWRTDGSRGLLEGKTCSRWLLPLRHSPYSGWEERAPLAYATQAAMQMSVLQEERCDLFAVVMDEWPRRTILRPIERNRRFEEVLVGRLLDFWDRYVQRDTPPPARPDPSAERVLRQLWPEPEPDRVYLLPPDREPLVRSWDRQASRIKRARAVQDGVKRELMERMRDAAICEGQDGARLFTWRATSKGNRTFRRSGGWKEE